MNFALMCQSLSSSGAGETMPQCPARQNRLRGGLVLLHSAVAEWLPATADNHPAVPEGSLGSQGEVTHCYARADRKGLVALPGFRIGAAPPGMVGFGGGAARERMGNKFVFSFRFQLAIVRVYQSQVLLLLGGHRVQWTQSTGSVGLRLN